MGSFVTPIIVGRTDRLNVLGPLAHELVKLLPELASSLSVSQPTPPLEAEVEKRRLFEAMKTLFLRQAKAGPLLFIVEDSFNTTTTPPAWL